MGIDAHALSSQLAFAFAGGDASERIRAILSDVDLTESAWDPIVFSKHLFLDTWIEHLCALPLGDRSIEAEPRRVRALLVHPPRDPAVREFRRRILAELSEDPRAKDEAIELYKDLRRLRASLLHAPAEGGVESTRRRVQILSILRSVLDRISRSFEGSTTGLGRLRELAAERVRSEHYARLVDLLEHDRHRASVEVHVHLGGDGHVRDLTIAKIVEDKKNRFYRTAAQRFWEKLALLVRGYRFSDAELIDRWLDAVYEPMAELLPGLLQLIGHLELYLVMLGFQAESAAKGLAVCLPRLGEGGRVTGLFNPLLLAQKVQPVPCDLELRGPDSTTVITGPNSGGKTRLLQSIGLLQLLAQGGLFVPARTAELREVPLLFCSLVQDESYDQTEGRLGTELLRIRRLFEVTPPGALVILDELCSGTNPSEGEEIFMLVISLLRDLGPETFVTTHFLDFAQRLEARKDELGLSFLKVELDARSHPTYGFVPGVAPTSLAGQAASRLGVTKGELSMLVKRQKP